MLGFEAFFREIDESWDASSADRIALGIIGSSALMLQADYERGTKDSDVLETTELTPETKRRLLAIEGKDSTLHTRYRIYLDIVPNGLPFLPQAPVWHLLAELNSSLRHFELKVLDVVDVVVSKLKRFNANDVSDVGAMIDKGLVPHATLIARFKDAVDFYLMDARAEELPQYVQDLHRVERDLFVLPESEIELPGWI